MFFISYIIVSHCMVLPLLVACIVRALHSLRQYRRALGPYPASRAKIETVLRRFAVQWSLFDPTYSGKLQVTRVPALLHQLPRPLGFARNTAHQPLTHVQHMRAVALLTELQITAGLAAHCDSDTADSLWRVTLRWLYRVYTIVVSAVTSLRRSKKKKKLQEVNKALQPCHY